MFNPFPNKPWFLTVSNTSLLKTQREKEKLLVMSNFSSSLSVFFLYGKLSAFFLSNFELSSANFFSLEKSKICHLGKGNQAFIIISIVSLQHTAYSCMSWVPPVLE